MILAIESELLPSLQFDDIIQTFTEKKARWKILNALTIEQSYTHTDVPIYFQ